ncbi:MAG: hypothetical protein ABWY93_18660 [Mycobacterium sp.]
MDNLDRQWFMLDLATRMDDAVADVLATGRYQDEFVSVQWQSVPAESLLEDLRQWKRDEIAKLDQNTDRWKGSR